ncbi:MAG: DUF2927 domain-containing protein [Pseudomonadota bacterium]
MLFCRLTVPICALGLLVGCAEPSAGLNWYAVTEAHLQQGHLRTDRAVDEGLPLVETTIANFERIAFDVEADPFSTGTDQSVGTSRILRRWERPVVYHVVELDRSETSFKRSVAEYMDRIRELTGHPITLGKPTRDRTPDDPSSNLLIVYGPDELFRFLSDIGNLIEGDETRQGSSLRDGLSKKIGAWRTAPSPCAGTLWHVENERKEFNVGEILAAFVFVRSEIPELLRDVCVEEEIAQLMGLMNDHPKARPSIFNDDQEFALLTDYDGMLLRILYDDRLSPGMGPEEAMPIVRRIAEELASGS